MTLALDPELIVQARENAVEAGVDFEEWLTEAILAKIRYLLMLKSLSY